MSVNDISLTAAMRSNLLSLQQTADLMARTQTRLSTGKKVNSAIDNPTAYFASQALNSRASILDALKDAMGQAISTVEAANKGIKALTALIEQAKGIATQAQSAGLDSDEGKAYAAQYNAIRTQIDALANDSGYQGKNLLKSAILTVKFESTNLDITGFDATTNSVTGLNIAEAAVDGSWDAADSVDKLDAALVKLRTQAAGLSANLSIITTRMDFTTDMENTLMEGSNKLTLADTNEEGANMLMLQTRQSLSTTALGLASQAAQAVLKLFQ
jgi:flagellin